MRRRGGAARGEHLRAAGSRAARDRAPDPAAARRARARATRSCAGAWPSTSCRARASPRCSTRSPTTAGDRQRGHGRGRARGAAARVAAPARLARGGRAGPARCTSSWAPPRARGTPAAAIPASSTAAPASRRRWTGRPPTRRTSTRRSAPSSTRAVPRASARSAACVPCSRASPRCWCSPSSPAPSPSTSAATRATRRSPPTRNDWARAPCWRTISTPRCCSPARASRSTTRVQTRGSLLAALGKSPAAIGVMRGDGERMWELALSPDERTLAAGDPAGNVFLFDTRTQRRIATVRPERRQRMDHELTYSPDGSRLAIAHDTRAATWSRCSTPAAAASFRTFTPPRPGLVTALRFTADDNARVHVRPGRRSEREPALSCATTRGQAAGCSVPCASTAASSPLLATSDGRRLITAGDGEVAVRDAATLRVRRRYRVGPVRPAALSDRVRAQPRRPHAGDRRAGRRGAPARPADRRGAHRLRPPRRRRTGPRSSPATAARCSPRARTTKVIVWDVRQAAAGETLSGHASGIVAPGHAERPDALLRRPRRHGVHLGPRGARRLGRPFKAGAGGDEAAAAVSSGRPPVRAGPGRRRDHHHGHAHARARAPFRVGGSGESLRIRFVPGSRLMVVGGARRDSWRSSTATRGESSGACAATAGAIYTPGISADGRLLATGSDDRHGPVLVAPGGQPLGAPLRFRRELWRPS